MQEFETRKKMLFECLESAEKSLVGTNLYQASDIPNLVEKPAPIKIGKFRGKESIFKKPELPLIKCLKPRRTPDYQINPHKWKRYTLGDIDISDKTNASAAFAFLREIDARKEENSEQMNEKMKTSGIKPVFKKSKMKRGRLEKPTADEKSDEDKSQFKGSKLFMPQYEIGKKPEKKNQTSIQKVDTSQNKRQLKLAHLDEEEEDSVD